MGETEREVQVHLVFRSSAVHVEEYTACLCYRETAEMRLGSGLEGITQLQPNVEG